MILNTPDISNKSCEAFIYINGPAFLKEFEEDGSKRNCLQSGVPYYTSISKDYKWMVTRNQVVKDELYLQQVNDYGNIKIQCIR